MIFGPSSHIILYFWVSWDKIGNHLRIFFLFKKARKSNIIYSQVLSFPVTCSFPLLPAKLLHSPGPFPLAVHLHEDPLSASFPAEEENIKREDLFSSVPTKGTHNPYNYEASDILLLSSLFANSLFLSVEVCLFSFFFSWFLFKV